MNESLTSAVVRVGDGRGFIVAYEHQHLVVTAAHCLPEIPPAHPARHQDECTWLVLGPLDEEPTVVAECLFCDTIADLAVLGEPDGQEFYEEYETYLVFTEGRPALQLGDIPRSELRKRPLETHPVHVLQLGGQWARGRGKHIGRSIMLDGLRVESGMSGSPILNADGAAVGAISTGSSNPRLASDLPAWLAPKAADQGDKP
jgi:Peptidase S7, Flavivirus NS3 serine protease